MPLSLDRLALGAAVLMVGAVTLPAACSSSQPVESWAVPGMERRSLTCDGDGDACSECAGTSCCDAIEACDDACAAAYSAFVECLFPAGRSWSGFGSRLCRDRAKTDTTGARAIIDCATARCGGSSGCGAQPAGVFDYPAAEYGADFSAGEFLEKYCNGCHNPVFVPPPGKWVTPFSVDPSWQKPLGNAVWMTLLDYDAVVGTRDAILCGVFPAELPEGCTTLSSVAPGFFEKPEKFPPKAPTGYAGGPTCPFGEDGMHCPQPTAFERARMATWLLDGTVRR